MAEIRVLRQEDDRSLFRSGNASIDRFFAEFAGQNQFRHHMGVTYLAVAEGRILGFVTVSAAPVEAAVLPVAQRRRLPSYPLPALRLSRLGVDLSSKGQGVGQALVRFALELARDTAERIGCVGVLVDAKAGAIAFYEKLGFFRLDARAGTLGDRPEPVPMFVALGSIPVRVKA